jgi:hypothetical protein
MRSLLATAVEAFIPAPLGGNHAVRSAIALAGLVPG